MNPHIHALKRRKTYNALVSDKGIEDFALRSVAASSRRWSARVLAGTAIGGISFLALEVIGASLILNYGFTNATFAILAGMGISFVLGVPIAYHASKSNVDIDLLTRGSGFGYFGSTLTSLIYASYTIIFFAMEGAIMAKALNLSLGLSMTAGYLISSLVIIPIAFYGITMINRLQKHTQAIWIGLTLLAVGGILWRHPEGIGYWTAFRGAEEGRGGFDPELFGAALSITLALVPQIGEQVDYLRFMPDKTPRNARSWWAAVLGAGPGWSLLGALKMLTGSYLAVQCLVYAASGFKNAGDPMHMYLTAFGSVFHSPALTLLVTAVFVITCQIKINATNAYAGSLAWSNFFLRIMQSHPGRGVWLVFNVAFSYLFMQIGVEKVFEYLLMGYASFAAAWLGAIFTDLAVLKPAGLSPAFIEYRRAFLYDINPVGFGGMCIALAASLAAQTGVWGPLVRACTPILALFVSVISVLTLAVLTRGKYYLARQDAGGPQGRDGHACGLCGDNYENRDMLYCPAYGEQICSLCCSLDTLCNRLCNEKVFDTRFKKYFSRRFLIFFPYFITVSAIITSIFFIGCEFIKFYDNGLSDHAFNVLAAMYAVVMAVVGIWAWWAALIQQNMSLAEEELAGHIRQLEREAAHRKAIAADLDVVSRQQQLILENASIGIAFAKDNRLIWANRHFWACFGLREGGPGAESELEKLFAGCHCAFGKLEQEAESAFQGRSTCTREILLRHSGRDHWCILSINCVSRHSHNEGCILLLDDISERKFTEQQLQQSQKRLRELNENLEQQVLKRTEELKHNYETIHRMDKMASLGILVSGMAHEINNPVSFIMLNSGVLQRTMRDMLEVLNETPGDKSDVWLGGMNYAYARRSIPKLLGGIRDGAERISAIVRNLKDYARQTPVNMSGRVDLNAALDTSLSLLANFIRKSTDNLEVRKHTPMPLFGGDQRRVEQVIINVVQNACQALPDRSRGIVVGTSAHPGHVELTVRDFGAGILPEDLKHVQDPFFTTKRDIGGTGLGLSVSGGIMKEHGGSLDIVSEYGQGTTVTLRFPLSL